MVASRFNLQRISIFLLLFIASLFFASLFLAPGEATGGPVADFEIGDPLQPAPGAGEALSGSQTTGAIDKEAALNRDGGSDFAALMAQAQEEGRVRVLLELALPFQAEGLLAEDAGERQRQLIANTQDEVIAALVDLRGGRLHRRYTYVPLLAMELDAEGLEAARDMPAVRAIHEDAMLRLALGDTIPLINANQAWASGYTGQGWAVAVLDTGVDKSHPFLSGKVVAEACFSTNQGSQGLSSVCPNGQETQIGSGAGEDCAGNVAGCSHGTHVAGIVAGDNASFAGVAPDASLIAVQVFTRLDSSSSCYPSPSPCVVTFNADYIAGLDYVYSLRNTHNIAAVNMSLGGGRNYSNCDTHPAKPSIDTLRSAGIATVIASGNNGFSDSMGWPACISSAVSVGNTTKSDVVNSSSNSVNFLNLLAPGTSILSSVPGGGYASYTGTSMAAPHVAGAWALYKQYRPAASVTEVLNNFVNSGVQVTDWRNGITKPRLELTFFSGGPSPTPTPTATPGPQTCQNIVVDGSYENSPPSQWYGSGEVYQFSGGGRTGNYYVRLGRGEVIPDLAVMWQNQTLPATLSSSRISFWYQLDSDDSASTAYDFLTVSVRNSSGTTILATVAERDNRHRAAGWTQLSYNLTPSQLAAIAGQPVRLDFRLSNDEILVTVVRIDDVVWEVCTSSSGAPTPTPTRPAVLPYDAHLPIIVR